MSCECPPDEPCTCEGGDNDMEGFGALQSAGLTKDQVAAFNALPDLLFMPPTEEEPVDGD